MGRRRPIAPRRFLAPPPKRDPGDAMPYAEVHAMYASFVAEGEAIAAAELERDAAARMVREAARALEPPKPARTPPPFETAWAAIDAIVESPIERQLARAMVMFVQLDHGVSGAIAVIDGAWLFYGQYQIGPYRADFALVNPSTFPAQVVVIEADGHEFHSTDEQVTRDAQRDRWMALKGIRVLRFAGTEIHNHADRCAAEVMDHVLGPRRN